MEASHGPEFYELDIPVAPDLLRQVDVTARLHDVADGGVYDAQTLTVAVYDRPWLMPDEPGSARMIGMLHLSLRTGRVYRVEVHPEAGGTFEAMLTHLERLTGLAADPR